jgi:membrane fusion protein, heavy metal efflux system
VVERNLNPGQDLRPDPYGPGVPPLFVISDPSVLWVQIDVRESDLFAINKGSAFVLEVASLPGQVFEGRVTAMADTLDPATRTINVRGVVNNPKRVLKAEMLGTARFEASQGDGVVVPASAVALAGTQHAVYVKTGVGVFERREVGVSRQDTRQVVIHKGLAAGEEVVSDNLLLLARTFRLAESETQGASSAPKDTAPAPQAPVRKTP